jgi:N-acetyl-gamma-glutamyl-phosphate reductase
MVRVAVLGATGYAARELLLLLARHPDAEVVALTSRSDEELTATASHPMLQDRLSLKLQNLSPGEVAEVAECVLSCLPHAASAESVAELLERGCRVIDFSADYRLRDQATYEQWYGVAHPDPVRLATAVYGLPELYREAIGPAALIANPGCYPTGAILGLAPLLRAGVVSAEGLIIDSKSGVSGGGRSPKPHLHFSECNESVSAYGVGAHRHTPEIDQYLSEAAGTATHVVFTPHLIPMQQGILTTAYGRPQGATSDAQLLECLRAAYQGEPFVRVVDHLPATKDVAHTNYCNVTARLVRGRVIVISVIDNLIKGAAGAAVQNFNLMYGYPETTGL